MNLTEIIIGLYRQSEKCNASHSYSEMRKRRKRFQLFSYWENEYVAVCKKNIKRIKEFGLDLLVWRLKCTEMLLWSLSVKMLSTRELNHKLFEMYGNQFSFCGVFCKIEPFFCLFGFFFSPKRCFYFWIISPSFSFERRNKNVSHQCFHDCIESFSEMNLVTACFILLIFYL